MHSFFFDDEHRNDQVKSLRQVDEMTIHAKSCRITSLSIESKQIIMMKETALQKKTSASLRWTTKVT